MGRAVSAMCRPSQASWTALGADLVAVRPDLGEDPESGMNPDQIRNRGAVTCETVLLTELKDLRRVGLSRQSSLALTRLRSICRQVLRLEDQEVERPHIEKLLKLAIDTLGGGEVGDGAEILFGLAPGTRGLPPTQLRRRATERFYDNSSVENKEAFRKTWEAKRILPELAAVVCSFEIDAPQVEPSVVRRVDNLVDRYRDLADMAAVFGQHTGSRMSAVESQRWTEARGLLHLCARAVLDTARGLRQDSNAASIDQLDVQLRAVLTEWWTPYDATPELDADLLKRTVAAVTAET